MARHTKLKIAALATSLVAALGVLAVSPATASNAGGATRTAYDRVWCC
jgi:hypothetical protein